MKIHKLVIPTPFYVGPINIYLIDDEPLTLIDTGPRTEEALSALRQQLLALRYRVDDIKQIILTHTHEDHCGLAKQIQALSGARVFVHEWEADRLGGTVDYEAYTRLFERAGVPPEIITEFAQFHDRIANLRESLTEFEVYQDGTEFSFASGSLRAIHTPGHTTGSTSFWRESNRTLIAGDTVLKRITPNPVLHPDPIDATRRFPSLGEYLVSLARIKALAPTLVYTAHGDEVTDYLEHFTRTVKHTDERQAKVLNLLPKAGVTAWELSQLMFPKVEGMHVYLALCEASAHLDLAVAEGKARISRQSVQEIFLPGGA